MTNAHVVEEALLARPGDARPPSLMVTLQVILWFQYLDIGVWVIALEARDTSCTYWEDNDRLLYRLENTHRQERYESETPNLYFFHLPVLIRFCSSS